ncbi:FtsX-like permease family protein [Nonomuraea sp. PA05]|uniref:FtsX-like permease family protein n=1 Tax=Nonomuraea sp. PA05 TaxID=2604466 RepID=UPI0011DAFB89|nr:FtsX-like permease family protein [Nonomuraea sp. PA05]TYB50469.1 FtsX-like permease family protein [Nonomuraea sp. PA05]
MKAVRSAGGCGVSAVRLGLRLALAGGRESLARLGLTAFGVGVGVVLLLLCLTGQSALQGRADRATWRDSTSETPPTAQDAALWLGVSDHYAGEPLFRLHVAALGPRPPVPPGLDRLPSDGEVAVSPALRRLIEAIPADQLGDRFPGRIAATVGPAALTHPDQLVAVVGHSVRELRAHTGAQEVRGIQTGPPGDHSYTVAARLLLGVGALLLLVPVVVFIVMVTRIAAVRREQRFAAMRLAGATRAQTAVMAAAETGLAAAAGALLGLLGYLAVRPLVAAHLTHGGVRFLGSDVSVPAGAMAAVLAGVPLLAVATTAVSLRGLRVTPLGIGPETVRRRPPRAWRVLPPAAGVLGLCLAPSVPPLADEGLYLWFLLPAMVGTVVAGPWLCLAAARVLGRLGRRFATLMAARRVAGDPRAAFRAVSGVVLTVSAATFAAGLASEEPGGNFHGELRPGVIEVYVGEQPAGRLAPLMGPGTVVVRVSGGGSAVSCADLELVVNASCPLPATARARGLGRYATIGVMSGELREPAPGHGSLPVRALYVRTDGSLAAEERVRTRAAIVLPRAIVNSRRDTVLQETRLQDELTTYARLVTWFVILVAGCSLTVGAVAGLIERRRSFALLRAAGARLAELRRIVLVETAVPLVLSILMGAALGSTASYAVTAAAGDPWTPPGLALATGLAGSALAAMAITMAALPLLNVTTRYDAVRFE